MDFVPACEICRTPVPNATTLRRVRCNDCLTDAERDRQRRLQPRTTTAKVLIGDTRRNRSTGRLERGCDHCGGPGPRKSYRLNPRNWSETYALLCLKCRRDLGYQEVDWARADRHGGYIEPNIRRSA